MVDPDIRIHMLRTYVVLRRLMAFATGLFLVILSVYREYGPNDPDPHNSISAYYYHSNVGFPMRSVFVAALTSIGLLLVAYQGYRNAENVALNLGGVALVCVVFFPMDWPPSAAGSGAELPHLSWHAWVHYISAFTFFGSLAYVSIFRAQDTLALVSSEARRAAYKATYKVLGVLMLLAPGLAFVIGYVAKFDSTTFWVEYSGVAVFLVYWLIKSMELELCRVETLGKIDELPKKYS